MNWWTKLPTSSKVLIGTALGGLGYFGYRWYANKKAAAAASTTPTQDSSIPGEGTTSQGPTTGGMGYFGGGGPVTGGGTGGTPGPTGPAGPAGPPGKGAPTTPPGPKGPPATGPSSNPFGLNEQTINGQRMAEIGVITGKGRFSGRNVGGGAPVSFYIPKGVPGGGRIVSGLTKAQIDALPAGTQIFTPTSYYKDIAAKQVTNSGI